MSRHYLAAAAFVGLFGFGLFSLVKHGLKNSARAQISNDIALAVKGAGPGKFADIEERLRRLSEKYPESLSVLLNMGIAQAAQGKLDEADRTFEAVLDRDPSDWDAIAERATILLQKGQEKEAIALLEKIPPGEGQMTARLSRDPSWRALRGQEGMQGLLQKHGLAGTNTSLSGPNRFGKPIPLKRPTKDADGSGR